MKANFSINNNMLNRVIEISKVIGNLELQAKRNLKLRKENRIKAIQSSLAIENNSLTIEQITAIIEGKRVLGDPKEIKEVKNAYDVYEAISMLNPYEQADFLNAHLLLTRDLVKTPGQYRIKDVGVFDELGNVIHMGARSQFIGELMSELFEWGANDKAPEIIKSCIFHYEIEAIHPFEDGNGRMGRLWQTVILAKWQPIFAWLPVETIIHENQGSYYKALAKADKNNDSSVFVEFMLDIIYETLTTYMASDEIADKSSIELSFAESHVFSLLNKYLVKRDYISTAVASTLIHKSDATTRRYLVRFVELGLLKSSGSNKNRKYSLKK